MLIIAKAKPKLLYFITAHNNAKINTTAIFIGTQITLTIMSMCYRIVSPTAQLIT